MRTVTRIVAAVVLLAALGYVGFRFLAAPEAVSATIDAGERGDAGDEQTLTTFDGAMVRERAAIGVLPQKGVTDDAVRAQMQAAAKKANVGPLIDANFAVFSAEMLNYLVPPVTMVLPEGVKVETAEAFMRDHQPADVAFYLVEPVLVHDVTFAAFPTGGISPTQANKAQETEGILYDSLNKYDTKVQPAGVVVHYFGAVLSDATIATVRSAMGRAAKVPADRVAVSASLPDPGVDLSNGVPSLTDGPHGKHN
ncbi:hypothetical protein [Actinoplanes solisilvae]|uniref:hypothetical protein n=1 Tax=Actinoplanes solisilvae TaxID=2486853 RepID=UPI000FDB7299|nr:hypothetical protein [Actinoplanes solisilvae]